MTRIFLFSAGRGIYVVPIIISPREAVGDSWALSLGSFGPDFLSVCVWPQSAPRPQRLGGAGGILPRADSVWNLCPVARPGLLPPPGPAAQSAAQPPAPEDAHPVQGVRARAHHRHW